MSAVSVTGDGAAGIDGRHGDAVMPDDAPTAPCTTPDRGEMRWTEAF